MILLKDIVSIEKGKGYDLIEEYQEGSIRVFRANDFRNESKPQFTLESEGLLAKEDDILVVWDGSVGQMGFGKSGYVGSTIVRVRVKNKKEFSPFFIYKFLQTKSEFLKRKSTGATIMHINRKSLEQLEVPSLSFSKQIQIANILSKAESLIQYRRESVDLLDKFLQNTFLQMFGDPGTNPRKWNLSKLENSFLAKPLIGSMIPAIDNGTIPIVRVGEIGSREINFAKCKFSNLGSSDLKKYRLIDGDILLARAIGSESHLGKASIFCDRGLQVVYDSHVMRLRFDKNKIHPEFFYTFLQTQGGRKRFMRKAGQTSIQFNVNSKQISDIDIPVPPIELQTEFANIVSRTEALKREYKNSLVELENLYGSLSQKAFKGELEFNNQQKVSAL